MTTTDPRTEALSKMRTDTLTALLAEIFDKSALMSSIYLAIGMSEAFRATTPAELFELIVEVLRTRLAP